MENENKLSLQSLKKVQTVYLEEGYGISIRRLRNEEKIRVTQIFKSIERLPITDPKQNTESATKKDELDAELFDILIQSISNIDGDGVGYIRENIDADGLVTLLSDVLGGAELRKLS